MLLRRIVKHKHPKRIKLYPNNLVKCPVVGPNVLIPCRWLVEPVAHQNTITQFLDFISLNTGDPEAIKKKYNEIISIHKETPKLMNELISYYAYKENVDEIFALLMKIIENEPFIDKSEVISQATYRRIFKKERSMQFKSKMLKLLIEAGIIKKTVPKNLLFAISRNGDCKSILYLSQRIPMIRENRPFFNGVLLAFSYSPTPTHDIEKILHYMRENRIRPGIHAFKIYWKSMGDNIKVDQRSVYNMYKIMKETIILNNDILIEIAKKCKNTKNMYLPLHNMLLDIFSELGYEKGLMELYGSMNKKNIDTHEIYFSYYIKNGLDFIQTYDDIISKSENSEKNITSHLLVKLLCENGRFIEAKRIYNTLLESEELQPSKENLIYFAHLYLKQNKLNKANSMMGLVGMNYLKKQCREEPLIRAFEVLNGINRLDEVTSIIKYRIFEQKELEISTKIIRVYFSFIKHRSIVPTYLMIKGFDDIALSTKLRKFVRGYFLDKVNIRLKENV
eukprot:TRINITY_DN8345_c0_g1_i1.p1 TRINITY_DN8345_c0_g1~~TRINITY_DN8345_c0_g1_i1.p1  ORF type:complete len:506 (-),score=61.77 TRINITY_DN8345_c0_g1_i1:58-1575(-)